MNKHRQEYIGTTITVETHPNVTLQNVTGTVRDETMHTFLVETNNTMKTVPKHGATFTINTQTVHGNNITKRPHDRIKMKL